MLNETVGKQIRDCRRQRHMTQEELADHLHISHQMVSRWENGLALPDIETLLALSRIFGESLDFFCGKEMRQQECLLQTVREEAPFEDIRDYAVLLRTYPRLEARLRAYPLNDDLLAYALAFLRQMHDTIQTDEQKAWVNDRILTAAERLLDISQNDDHRSAAHYHLAVYFTEQVVRTGEPAPDQQRYLQKAREHADRVYYRHMIKTFYHDFGAETDEECAAAQEKTLWELLDAAAVSLRNLRRLYHRLDLTSHEQTVTAFAASLSALLSESRLNSVIPHP